MTLQTVQGPAKFNSVGENTVASMFIFQWQNRAASSCRCCPPARPDRWPIMNPKPNWSS